MTQKILLVDDDTLIRNGIGRKFEEQGYAVVDASDGDEGLRVALQEHPDLIVSDVLMPRMDGLKMLENLRQDEWGKTALVLMLTNDDTLDSLNEALGEGVTHYLPKIMSIDELMAQIKLLLSAD